MNKSKIFIAALMIGTTVGWCVGYLRLPYFEGNNEFYFGFIISTSLFALLGIALMLRKNNPSLKKILAAKSSSSKNDKGHLWLVISCLLVISFTIFSILIARNNSLSKEVQKQEKENRLRASENLLAKRKSNSLLVINDIFTKIDAELAVSKDRKLSNETIQRLVNINHSFEPFHFVEGEGLEEYFLSPERGQLLLMLCDLEMDSTSFRRIKSEITFKGADLRRVNLTGKNLSYFDFPNANFDEALLDSVNFYKSDLSEASLKKASLMNSFLTEVILYKARLSWANLNNSIINDANLGGADLSNSQIRNSELKGADIRWANLDNTFLNGSDLSKADLKETSARKVNFINTNLTDANLISSDLSAANFTQADMSNTQILNAKFLGSNWFKNLKEQNAKGIEDFEERFKIVIAADSPYNLRLQNR